MWSKKIKFYLGGVLLILLVLVFSQEALALDVNYILEVPIGGEDSVTGVADYIDKLYRFLIGIAGVAATGMIMFGGWQWIFAAGNEQAVTSAKEHISSAIIGLVLALSSYLILFTINPSLVQLVALSPTEIDPASACSDDEERINGPGTSCTKDCQCALGYVNLSGDDVYMQCTYRGENELNTKTGQKHCAIPDGYECARGTITKSVNLNGVDIEPVSFKLTSAVENQCVIGSKCLSSHADTYIDDETIEVVWHCKETSQNGLVTLEGRNHCIYPEMLDPDVNYRCNNFNGYAQTQ